MVGIYVLKREVTLDEMKKIELNIMKYIHNICEENNIYYVLAYGSCLGAVRHKGFIPWDDDIDILIPYPDYKRFIEICCENNGRYKLEVPGIDTDYLYPYCKMVDTNTIMVEYETIGKQIGVYVDIFPLYGISTKDKLHLRLIELIDALAITSRKKRPAGRTWITKMVHTLLFIPAKILGNSRLNRWAIKLAKKYPFETATDVAFLPWIYASREHLPKSVFTKRKLVDFEDTQFYIPDDYDCYLTTSYGDYMVFPPEKQRENQHLHTVYFKE